MSMHQIKFFILKFFLLFDIYPFSPSTYLTVPMVQCSVVTYTFHHRRDCRLGCEINHKKQLCIRVFILMFPLEVSRVYRVYWMIKSY